jgi:hypothetical protein
MEQWVNDVTNATNLGSHSHSMLYLTHYDPNGSSVITCSSVGSMLPEWINNPHGRTYTWYNARYSAIPFDHLEEVGLRRKLPTRNPPPRPRGPTPYQRAQVKALESWDRRLSAQPIVETDKIFLGSWSSLEAEVNKTCWPKEKSNRDTSSDASLVYELAPLIPDNVPEASLFASPTEGVRIQDQSLIDFTIQGFSAMEVDDRIAKKDDNEVSMGDKYEYDGEQDTKEGSYAQVSPSSPRVSSTNHWFLQCGVEVVFVCLQGN